MKENRKRCPVKRPGSRFRSVFRKRSSRSVLRELMLTKTHPRLPSLRKFHASHIYSGKLQASVPSGFPKAKVNAKPPRPWQRKDKKATGRKRNEGKRSRNESFTPSMNLSSMLQRRIPRQQHAAVRESTRLWASLEETQLRRSLRLATPKGKLSMTGASVKWVAHPRTSENDTAGGLPFPS